jgi:hypothetical protein
MRYDPAEMIVAQAPDAPIRLFIAPSNFAGQGWQWARAAERNIEGVRAVSMAYHGAGEFGYPTDISVPVSGYVFSKDWQNRQRAAVTSGFTHVGVEAERHPFGRVFDQSVETQVKGLVAAGVRVAFLCHGTDIRLPSRHAAVEEFSPYKDSLWEFTPQVERECRENRALLDKLGLPVFVSTPGLIADVPYATWMPVIVDAEKWATDALPLQGMKPVVAHAPSAAVIKGSDLIDPIMRRLHDEGIVDYVRIEGVSAEKMPEVYRTADIVLDQFRLGDYGVAACESLAAGRLVIGHVSDSVRAFVREQTGRDLPILEATAHTLERVIREICGDQAAFQRYAGGGSDFVRAVHDGRRSAEAFRTFLAPGMRPRS